MSTHAHPLKGHFSPPAAFRSSGLGSNTRGRATLRALSPPGHAPPTCRTGARKSLQVWPCKAELCVSPVAFPLTALVRAGRTRGELDLPARRQHDERRGAVSVLAIPLSLGCPVPLPPCPSACGTESGESSLVIGSGAVRLSPHPAEPLPFPADTRHNLALAECFCREPRARQTGALTRGRRCKAWAWPLSRPFFA